MIQRGVERNGRRLSGLVALGVGALLLAGPAAVSLGQTAALETQPTPADKLAPQVDAYRQHIETLANPFFEGRAPGTRGNRLAADYVEFEFRRLGLKPAFPPGTPETMTEEEVRKEAPPSTERVNFRQPFIAPRSQRPGDSVKLMEQGASYALGGDAAAVLSAGEQFNVLGYSGSGAATGPLVFVGYAITSETREYDSFPLNADGTAVDLSGKIALVLRFEPMNKEGKSKWSGEGWSPLAGLEPKLRAIEKKGAAGIILVNPPGADDDRVNKLEDLSLSGNQSLKVPVVMMSIAAADAMVKGADAKGRDLLGLRQVADEEGGVIDLGKASVTLKAELKRFPLWTDNVGGLLEGVGPLAEQLIVIGAHYDHVGYGYFGSRDRNPRGKIHPGADDNASGTSGMLLLAESLSKAYKAMPADAPRRTILFLGFSAEESGLNGSRHYCRRPIAPLDRHYLMINLDMIGRLREEKLQLQGSYTAEGFKDWLQPFVDASGMKIALTRGGSGPSDHASFYAKKMPVLFFHTDLHAEYHKPEDTAKTINVDGAARVADLVHRIAMGLSTRAEPLVFIDPNADKKEGGDKPTTPDPNNPDATNLTAMGGVSVRFGIAPGDYSGTEPGILIGEISPGGLPAEKAGLKAGDLMTKWNGEELKDVEGWMAMLAKHQPGDRVQITYRRDGQEHTTEATLVARTRRGQ